MPAGASAQCEIDLIESGIQSYRELELERAQELLRYAITTNREAASSCAPENARALTYIGASLWLLEQPELATASFELAVIEAPQFRPDVVEFPPDITNAFDRARRATPSVAVAAPNEVEISPESSPSLRVRLLASTGHWVTVDVRATQGDMVIPLYDGPVTAGAQGTVVEWAGRDARGDVVPSGDYDLEVVSLNQQSRPLRKVTVPLTVEARAPPLSIAPPQIPAASSQGSLWGALATGGSGLVAGGLVIGLPLVVEGFPEARARYAVGGSLAVAGLIGLALRLREGGGDQDSPARAQAVTAPPNAVTAPTTLLVRVGPIRRVELGPNPGDGAAPGPGGR